MAHQRHLDTIEGIKKTGWGKKFDQPLDAEKDLIESPAFAGWAVLSVGNKIDQIVDDFTRPRFRRMLREITGALDAERRRRIQLIEERHGPMPVNVRSWIVREFYAACGRCFWEIDDPHWTVAMVGWHERPPKGSDLRKEYDAYMRRKPPKAKT